MHFLCAWRGEFRTMPSNFDKNCTGRTRATARRTLRRKTRRSGRRGGSGARTVVPAAEWRFFDVTPSRNIRVAPAAAPRYAPAEYPRGTHGVAATCPHGRSATPVPAGGENGRSNVSQTGSLSLVGAGTVVEKSAACDHMRCRCGARFCYKCGARGHSCPLNCPKPRVFDPPAPAPAPAPKPRAPRAPQDDSDHGDH